MWEKPALRLTLGLIIPVECFKYPKRGREVERGSSGIWSEIKTLTWHISPRDFIRVETKSRDTVLWVIFRLWWKFSRGQRETQPVVHGSHYCKQKTKVLDCSQDWEKQKKKKKRQKKRKRRIIHAWSWEERRPSEKEEEERSREKNGEKSFLPKQNEDLYNLSLSLIWIINWALLKFKGSWISNPKFFHH